MSNIFLLNRMASENSLESKSDEELDLLLVEMEQENERLSQEHDALLEQKKQLNEIVELGK